MLGRLLPFPLALVLLPLIAHIPTSLFENDPRRSVEPQLQSSTAVYEILQRYR